MMDRDRHIQEEIAENERWLSGFETPGPDAPAVKRVQNAVRREVESGRSVSATRWRAWQGALGAAAMLLLAVGLGWYVAHSSVTSPRMPAAGADDEATAAEAILPALLASSLEQTTQLAGMENAVSELETWADEDRWAASGASLFEALEDALKANGGDPPNVQKDSDNG